MDNNKNFFDAKDLESLFEELGGIEEGEEQLTDEEKASRRRYEEIIKKHKED